MKYSKLIPVALIATGISLMTHVVKDTIARAQARSTETADTNSVPADQLDLPEVDDIELPEADVPEDTLTETPDVRPIVETVEEEEPQAPVLSEPLPLDDSFYQVIINPQGPVSPFEAARAKDQSLPGKLMAPRDLEYLNQIQSLFLAKQATRTWGLTSSSFQRGGVMWTKTDFTLPTGMTSAFILFTKTGRPVVWARGSLVLDVTSSGPVQRQKDLISKAVLSPSQFPKSATRFQVPGSMSLTLHRKKNRLYMTIPTRLVMVEGAPRADISIMLATTDGSAMSSQERAIPMALDLIQHTLIAARTSMLLTPDMFS